MSATTKIPAALESIASDGIVASALYIYDQLRKLDQQTLNTTLLQIAEVAQKAAEESKQFNEDTQEAIKQLEPDQQEALKLALTVGEHTKQITALQTQLGDYSIIKTTEDEYEEMKAAGIIDENTIYFWGETVIEEQEET